MHPMLNIAVRAARKAGDIIVRHLDRVQELEIRAKGKNDYVSEVDRMAESAVIEVLHRAYPDHAVLAEESGEHGQSEFQWVIDPLDGTTNFLHGYPQFAVSIALKHKGRIEQGVIYDPMRQELYTASRGRGALLNDRRVRVSKRPGLEGALLGTGFPVRDQALFEPYIATFRAMSERTSGIRRAGAAALDLAYVACGRLDGFWEMGLSEWDMAAGVLMVEEAGGLVGDVTGDPTHFQTGNIAAGAPKVFKEMVKGLRPIVVGPRPRRAAGGDVIERKSDSS